MTLADSKRQFRGIDLFKFVFALAVVAIHAEPLKNIILPEFMLDFYNAFLGLAVPYFFIASGFFLFNRENVKQETLWKNALKILRFYLVWTIIYLPFSFHMLRDYNLPDALLRIGYSLLFTGGIYGPLWYLLGLFYTLIVIALFHRKGIKWIVFWIISLFGFVLSRMLSVAKASYALPYFLDLITGPATLLRAPFYVSAGMIIAIYKPRGKAIIFAATAIAGLTISTAINISLFGDGLTAVVAILTFLATKEWKLATHVAFSFMRRLCPILRGI